MKQCGGWPEGHVCVIGVPNDRTWCQGCIARRQEAIAMGIPASGILPIGVVLEDFEAPQLTCRCGGDPNMPDHEHSLLHLSWAWSLDPAKRTGSFFRPPRHQTGGLQLPPDRVSFSATEANKENR